MKKLLILMCATLAAAMSISCDGSGKGAYTITVDATEGGTAKADRKKADADMLITLTATPSGDAEFSGWKVVKGNAMLENTMATTTTFTMPVEDVEIKATFGTKTDAGISFRGLTWSTNNVAAPGTFAPAGEMGLVYQYNRKIGWSLTTPPVSIPTGETWNSQGNPVAMWAPENSPCPAGWRVPTGAEYLHMAGYALDQYGLAYRLTENNIPNGTPLVDCIWGPDKNSVEFVDKATGDKLSFLANGMITSEVEGGEARVVGVSSGFYFSSTLSTTSAGFVNSLLFSKDTDPAISAPSIKPQSRIRALFDKHSI